MLECVGGSEQNASGADLQGVVSFVTLARVKTILKVEVRE